MRKVFISLTAFVLIFGVSVGAATAETINWKITTFWPAASEGYTTMVQFAKRMEATTNGRLKIKTYPGGALIPKNEQHAATASGIIQGAFSWGGFITGVQPAFSPLTDLLGAYEDAMLLYDFFWYGGGMELMNQLYKPFGVMSLGPVIGGVESLLSNKRIAKPEDFKGVKIRSSEGMLADLFKALGGSVVVMGPGEMVQALDKGVIDAGDCSCPSQNYKYGCHRVAKYFTYPGFHSLPAGDFFVNPKAFAKLPLDIQNIMRDEVKLWAIEFSQQVRITDAERVQDMIKVGCVPVKWSDENLRKFRKISAGVWAEWSKKNAQCAQAIELHKMYLTRLGMGDIFEN